MDRLKGFVKDRFVKDIRMNTRKLFSKMAQIVILILFIVLAFFLIRGFARHEPHGSYRRDNPSERIRVSGSSELNALSERVELSKVKQ